jgi:hypothetical protein
VLGGPLLHKPRLLFLLVKDEPSVIRIPKKDVLTVKLKLKPVASPLELLGDGGIVGRSE